MSTVLRLVVVAATLTIAPRSSIAAEHHVNWDDHPDQIWVGRDVWANRLQDWRVRNGRLDCIVDRPMALRTAHLLTARAEAEGSFVVEARVGFHEVPDPASDASVGFIVGAGGVEMDYRAASLIQSFGGRNAGFHVGVDAAGAVFIRNLDEPAYGMVSHGVLDWAAVGDGGVVLRFEVRRHDAGRVEAVISVDDGPKHALDVPDGGFVGNIALVSHPGSAKAPVPTWFDDWAVSGAAITVFPDRALGPILSSQYTVHRGRMRMTVQLMPVDQADLWEVELSYQDGGRRVESRSAVVTPGWTAHFEIDDWPTDRDVEYVLSGKVGKGTAIGGWGGIIRRDPVDKPEIVLAAMSCNHNNSHNLAGGWGATNPSKKGDWPDGMWFPHEDLTSRVRKHEPDLLFFAGDQLYEGASPTPADRRHIELDYLYKWYLWCWAYRELTRDTPAIIIPDDHDVYQGNIWGHGGRATKRDNKGGYVHPAEWVKMVERTQTSNLPRPFDPTPIDQGIGVYYTNLTWGRVSFAVLEDRKFKSGCADERMPPTGTNRPDHVRSADVDTAALDLPGLSLLGDRQLTFLDQWASDWSGAELKAALSQTVFANLATHHGKNLDYLRADMDSNGWPQTGRRKAVERLRRAAAVHIAGDQHLSSLAQHGLDTHRDAIWSFCMPAAANFYPRQWLPPVDGLNRDADAPGWTGDHIDGFGNLVTMYAATNPRDMGREPKSLHNGMAGYGIIRFDKPARQVTFECWPRFADPDDASTGGQYDGWPVTIEQTDNDGRRPVDHLPTITVAGIDQPVVRVIDERNGELVYARRLATSSFRLPVFSDGGHTVHVGCPDAGRWRVLSNMQSTGEAITVDLSVDADDATSSGSDAP